MDIDLERRVNEAIEQLRKLSVEDINLSLLDPVAKMMLVALVNEVQKIQDYIDSTAQRIAERYCTDFIPHREISAVPAITLINPLFRPKKDTGIISVGTGDYFSYKKKESKIQINYIPLFNTSLLPYSDLYILTSNRMSYSQGVRDISMDKSNHVWIGITTKTEIESVQDLSLLISGTNGVLPELIIYLLISPL